MTAQTAHILLVDDERDILEILTYNLSKAGYRVSSAGDGRDALQKAEADPPDLIMLDLMMPGIDGIETCKRLRDIPALENTIILFLTARGEDDIQMASYHAGADDYVTKPIRPKVLVSKVKALLRRVDTTSQESTITLGDLVINLEEYKAIYGNRILKLPRKEFELLVLLVSRPDKVFTRTEILGHIWGKEIVVGDRTIDVHIRKLRGKIGSERIKTIKGVGYKYNP